MYKSRVKEMGFKFFHLPSHRVFDYPARHYNKDMEKFEGVNAEAKANEEGENYVPGSIVSKGFRRARREPLRKTGGYSTAKRVIVYILLAAILVALFYFAKVFSLLFNAYQTTSG